MIRQEKVRALLERLRYSNAQPNLGLSWEMKDAIVEVEEWEVERDAAYKVLQRIADGAESNPAHEVAELARTFLHERV